MAKKHHSSRTPLVVTAIGVLVAGALFFAFRKGSHIISPITPVDTASQTTPVPPPLLPIPKAEVAYHTLVLGTTKIGAQLVDAVGQEHLAATLSLNRVDIKHLQTKEVLVIPDSFDDPFALSSFPKVIPTLATVPKIILVDQRIQEFGIYEHGTLVRFGAVSTGKKSTPTPSKLYHANWKGRLVTSTVDDTWIMPWYFNLANIDGVSMHQFDLPGYPASHSCVRLSEEDAIWIYNWADEWKLSKDGKTVITNGTPVLLFGSYDYSKTAPWKKLPEDKNAMAISLEDLQKEIDPYLADIEKEL